jgi:hypothetical protein
VSSKTGRRRKLIFYFEAQQRRCCLCDREMALGVERSTDPEAASWEHLVSRSKGGGGKANLLLAHRACNSRRGNHPLMDLEKLRVKAKRIWRDWTQRRQAAQPEEKRAA